MQGRIIPGRKVADVSAKDVGLKIISSDTGEIFDKISFVKVYDNNDNPLKWSNNQEYEILCLDVYVNYKGEIYEGNAKLNKDGDGELKSYPSEKYYMFIDSKFYAVTVDLLSTFMSAPRKLEAFINWAKTGVMKVCQDFKYYHDLDLAVSDGRFFNFEIHHKNDKKLVKRNHYKMGFDNLVQHYPEHKDRIVLYILVQKFLLLKQNMEKYRHMLDQIKKSNIVNDIVSLAWAPIGMSKEENALFYKNMKTSRSLMFPMTEGMKDVVEVYPEIDIWDVSLTYEILSLTSRISSGVSSGKQFIVAFESGATDAILSLAFASKVKNARSAIFVPEVIAIDNTKQIEELMKNIQDSMNQIEELKKKCLTITADNDAKMQSLIDWFK